MSYEFICKMPFYIMKGTNLIKTNYWLLCQCEYNLRTSISGNTINEQSKHEFLNVVM